jgi:ATPase subunit of ABC transporter with duplicated ATPase domains
MRKELAWLRRGAPARTSKPKFRIEAANELIADIPPVRNPIELKQMAVSRLGKDVVDVLDAGVVFGEREILTGVTWRIGPGERTGILGANGTGKSTLLSLIAGTLVPTSGVVKRGKTVRLGMLDQQFSQLAEIGSDRVREVLGREKTTFNVDGKDLTPAQLLERLGFAKEHLSARVDELSGGQKRRLQLLLLLLSEPNVIVLDEPTNDVDSDMLAAMEDLLDSWPGTLLVVSHDRYLLERITDQSMRSSTRGSGMCREASTSTCAFAPRARHPRRRSRRSPPSNRACRDPRGAPPRRNSPRSSAASRRSRERSRRSMPGWPRTTRATSTACRS